MRTTSRFRNIVFVLGGLFLGLIALSLIFLAVGNG